MHADIAKKWCDALESDEYQQKRGALCQTVNGSTGFCCLGVLTDLYIKETGDGRWTGDGKWIAHRSHPPFVAVKGFANGREEGAYYLPICVKRWAGMQFGDPYAEYNGRILALSELNDNQGLDFHSIARLIRDNQEKL